MQVTTLMTWQEFSKAYCDRQEQTPMGLHAVLLEKRTQYAPLGFMLLECQMLDSSFCGQYTILPFGPHNTYKDVPACPVSPRGLASDMSCVVGVLLARDL
jgi:hypothetical protein